MKPSDLENAMSESDNHLRDYIKTSYITNIFDSIHLKQLFKKKKLTVLKICSAWIVMCTVPFWLRIQPKSGKLSEGEKFSKNYYYITDDNSQVKLNLDWIKNQKNSKIPKINWTLCSNWINRAFNYY